MPAITIYNTVIDTKVIVGIGPFVRIQRNDMQAQAYKELTFKFELYTLHYIVEISTHPLSFDSGSKQHSQLQYDHIRAVWEQLRDNLTRGWDLDVGWDKEGNLSKPADQG
jgi:hypothetical protein